MNEIVFGAGRLGRLHYFYWNLGLWAATLFIAYLTTPTGTDPDEIVDAIGNRFLLMVPLIWLSGSQATRRAHDLNHSGWLVVLLFVPFANIVTALYLTFWPGYEEPNRYGPPLRGKYVLSPAEMEQARAILAAEAAENERKHNERLLTDDGSFDMRGLYRESTVAGSETIAPPTGLTETIVPPAPPAAPVAPGSTLPPPPPPPPPAPPTAPPS